MKAHGSKPKIVDAGDAKAAFREKQRKKAEEEGLKKGGKEYVGSLPDQPEEDVEEEDFAQGGDDDEVEEFLEELLD